MSNRVTEKAPNLPNNFCRRYLLKSGSPRIFVFAVAAVVVATFLTYSGFAHASLFSILTAQEGRAPGPDKGGPTSELTLSPQYTQGFEVDNAWGDPPSDPLRVASGTNGITSKTGGWHGKVVQDAGEFTRWGGYSSTFPSLGYTTSIDVYLNVSGGYANDTRFDFSSAISGTNGLHRRDFVFSGGFYNDPGPVGSGNRFCFTASNNAPGNPRDPGRNPVSVSTSGWYTLKHRFYNNGGVLAVEMSLLNSSNIAVGTWTLSNLTDIIGSTVGGNRYGWFVDNHFPFLAIDNTVRSNVVPPTISKVSDLNPQGWAFFNEGAVGSGSFVTGPATPPLGTGSANLVVDANGRHNLGIAGYNGLRLDQISELGYSSYQISGNAASTVSLQLQVDYDLNDANPAFQGRLIYEPYQSGLTILQGTWQTWAPLQGKWWASGAPGNTVCPQATPCTWAQVLTAFPNAGIHANPALGAIIFRAGGPTGFSFDGNVDNFTLGINNQDTVFDFEHANPLVVDDDGLGSPTDCNGTDAVSTSISGSVAAASPGDTITVCPGTYPNASTINLAKANMTIVGAGPTKPVVQTPAAPASLFFVTGNGVKIDGLEIQKTDPHSPSEHDLIKVQGDNFTAQNNLIYGPDPGGTWNAVNRFSRAFGISAQVNTRILNNVIHTLRQPAYMSGGATTGGTISGNQVSGTKGWVVEGGDYVFTGNTFGEPQNQSCDIALLASIAPGNQPTYQPLVTLSLVNDDAFICQQYGALENGRAIAYVDDGAGPSGNGSDNSNYNSINTAIAGTLIGGTVSVAGGTYNEDVSIGKTIKLSGAGPIGTTISGPKLGPTATVAVAANSVEIRGFTITRDGNNLADWNDANGQLNSSGLSVQGAFTGMNVHDNLFTGNRSAIDVNNSSGHSIHNNVINNNHTGVIFGNTTNNISFVENSVTNNRTVGVLFLDRSSGTNVPVQQALNCTFFNNNISGNWYGQIVDREGGSGSLPTPGTSLKNLSGNWFGTNNPVITTSNSAEPGYAGLVPVGYPGGTAVAPGGQPDIAGPASANFDFSPYLNVGTDSNVETTPGRGTYGFQGTFNALNVSATSAQTGSASKIQEAIDLLTGGGTITVPAGTYAGNVDVNKVMTLKGSFTISPGTLTVSAAGATLSPGNSPGIINSGNLSLSSGSNLNMEINGTSVGTQYDQVNVTGTVSLGDANLNLTLGYTPAGGDAFTIINNDGVDPVTGMFASLPNNTVFSVGANTLRINYDGGDGNDVVLTAVSLCNAVSIPTYTALTGQTVHVLVNVDNTTGNGLVSTDFTLTYDPSVISSPVVSLGSVTAGRTLTVNTSNSGVIVVSVFGAAPFAGSGSLVDVAFTANGLPGTSSPVNFNAFKFNGGTPCITTSNGLVTILSGTITGTISYGNAIPAGFVPVPNASVNAVGSVNVSTTTAANGTYSLSGMGSGPYTVTPAKSDVLYTSPEAIYSNDPALIAQHVVGLITLTPSQLKAAKVSGNTTPVLSSFDAALIAQWIVGISNPINLTGKWQFTSTDTPFLSSRSYPDVNADIAGQDYTAILMGDVSGGWPTPARPAVVAERDRKNAIQVGISHSQVSSGATVTVPLTINNLQARTIGSYQFDIEFDPKVLEPATVAAELTGTMNENFSVFSNSPEAGRLKVVVFGVTPVNGDGVYVNLRFVATGGVGSSSPVNIRGFRFDDGDTGVFSTDGQVSIVAANSAAIRGRILSAYGQPVGSARVTLTSTTGERFVSVSSPLGHYEFGGLNVGETYTITVDARRFTFAPQTISVTDNVANVDLTAQP